MIPAGRWTWLLIAALAMPSAAQETVVPKRNVRTGWAQVLRVDPVYQTLTATAIEEQCEGEAADPGRHGLSRIVGAVKDALTAEDKPPAQPRPGCKFVPVERKFRRAIAYDVDYVYRGMKYRSRLPYDPGNRLRVRVSVVPHVPPLQDR